jgi:hypothetical protein
MPPARCLPRRELLRTVGRGFQILTFRCLELCRCPVRIHCGSNHKPFPRHIRMCLHHHIVDHGTGYLFRAPLSAVGIIRSSTVFLVEKDRNLQHKPAMSHNNRRSFLHTLLTTHTYMSISLRFISRLAMHLIHFSYSRSCPFLYNFLRFQDTARTAHLM